MILKARDLTYDSYLAYWRERIHVLWQALDQDASDPLRFGLERMPKFRWVDGSQLSIDEYLTAAWEKGAAECGIQPAEFTDDERAELQRILDTQTQRDWLNGFYDAIKLAHSQGLIEESLDYRARMWANRWPETFNRARAVFCGDRKYKWVLGEAEHCRSCLKLEGKIKRMSYWEEQGILPRVAGAEYLECHGFNCQCSLVETDEPQSKGPLPRLP